MKILVLTHRFPYPPVRGDCIRSWGEVEYLSRRHDVWLACVDRTRPAPADLARVRRCCRDVAIIVRSGAVSLFRGGLSLLVGGSLTEGYFHDARLARRVKRWDAAVGFDAVLTFSPAMAPYASLVRGARCVLDMNDVESCKWRDFAQRSQPPVSWLYGLEARRLPRAEAAWIRAHDIALLVNERERDKLPESLRARTAVVRTGVDLAHYGEVAGADGAPRVPREPVMGFVGSMFYAPNVRAVQWFGQAVWPRVRQAVPGARWLIVGNRPTRGVRAWGRAAGVTVTGFVADVRPYLRRMRVFVCPLREQIGVQTKLIEALAAGRPAVVTPEVAAGIDHDDPPPFAVSGSPAGFADAVIRLLRDDTHARALARRARRTAESTYDAAEQLREVERWLTGEASRSECELRRQAVAAPRGAQALMSAMQGVPGL